MANTQRAQGPATILAIGTANPGNVYYQADYPDFYFRVTNSDSMTQLKEKFKRICEKTMIRKRHLHITEQILKKNPQMCAYNAPSLNTRHDILVSEVPKLGAEAASKAIKEWGQPKSKITHLIFNSTSGVHMPGADFHITELLGLEPTIKRIMMYQQGCYVGGTLLRLAKDIVENNLGARVLLVCSEITFCSFHGPCETDIESLIGQAFIGDGASALIIGADPDTSKEKPLFELVSASETIIPRTGGVIEGPLREMGLEIRISRMVPMLISDNVEKCLLEAFIPFGVSDRNSLFWIVHPGGRLILDNIEAKLGLKEEKLEATRRMLAEYGNMGSASVFFILDEVRRRSMKEGKGTTGLGSEWGVLPAYGSGVTIDIVVLRSYPCNG